MKGIAVRLNDNLVGVDVTTIQDVVKAQAAGLYLLNKDGLSYECEVVDEDSGEEREPTEQEVFNRITKDLSEGNEVYACMYIEGGWCVQEKATTTMRTNFYVGQKVYLLRGNKIEVDEICSIHLVKSNKGEECKLILMGDQGHYTKSRFVFATKQELIESLMAE